MQHPAPPLLPPTPPGVIGYALRSDARDADHLRLLSIFHYVYGGVVALISCIFIIHIVLGIAMLQGNGPFGSSPPPAGTATTAPFPAGPPSAAPPPREIGWFFIGIGSAAIFFGWTLAGLTIASAWCIARRRARTFSLVVAGLNCLSVPLGTALGVFTFIVLLRESVAPLYAGHSGDPSGVAAPRQG